MIMFKSEEVRLVIDPQDEIENPKKVREVKQDMLKNGYLIAGVTDPINSVSPTTIRYKKSTRVDL